LFKLGGITIALQSTNIMNNQLYFPCMSDEYDINLYICEYIGRLRNIMVWLRSGFLLLVG